MMIILMIMIIIMTTTTLGMKLTRAALVIIMTDTVATASAVAHAATTRAMVIGHGGHRDYDHRVPEAASMNARRKTRAQPRPSLRDAHLKIR